MAVIAVERCESLIKHKASKWARTKIAYEKYWDILQTDFNST